MPPAESAVTTRSLTDALEQRCMGQPQQWFHVGDLIKEGRLAGPDRPVDFQGIVITQQLKEVLIAESRSAAL